MPEQIETALVFGKYQAIRRIKVGGMGEIFLARQTGVAGFDRIVILKTLLPELAEDPLFVEQFLDEARIAAMLNHPSIVSIYEVGEWQGLYVIAMEYIAGEDLGGLMRTASKAQVKVPHRITAYIVREAARALDHAHRAADPNQQPLHIVHRDIGMQNLMVRDDGVVKVVDFGISRAANRSTRTRTGLVKGKLQYMSPEQLRGDDLDGRSDQFSLGIVFWEMLTHRRLFKEENEFLAMQKIATGVVPPPTSIDPSIPAALEAIVMRMLERDREARHATCGDVAAAITAHLAEANESVDERQVAEFVHGNLGFGGVSRTSDLTPTAEVFASSGSFRGLGTPLEATVATASAQLGRERAQQRKRTLRVAVTSLSLLALGLVGAWPWRDRILEIARSGRPTPTLPTAIAPPPPVAPRPIASALSPEAPAPNAGSTPGDTATAKSKARGRKSLGRRGRTTPAVEPASGDGYLTLNATPWVKVTIDGRPYGSTPIFRLRLPAGPHEVHLLNEEAGISERRRVTITVDQNEKLNLTLSHR